MQGQMAIMDATGDTKVIWDTTRAAEVENAEKQFERLTKQGYLAYKVKPGDATKGEQIKKFDPQAGSIILAPRMVGG